jgi:hypothetical protein
MVFLELIVPKLNAIMCDVQSMTFTAPIFTALVPLNTFPWTSVYRILSEEEEKCRKLGKTTPLDKVWFSLYRLT